MDQDREVIKIIQNYHKDIYGFLRYLGADHDTAYELTQETFIIAYTAKNRSSDPGLFQKKPWFLGIAKNLFLKWWQRKKRDLSVQSHFSFHQAADFWEQHISQWEGGYSSYLEALRNCLKHLSPREHEIVIFRYHHKYSREKIARQLGLGSEGVKSLLRRIRKKLKICIRLRLESSK